MVFRGNVVRGNVVRGNVVRGNVVRGTNIEPKKYLKNPHLWLSVKKILKY
jgi:hypothetical protein